MFFVESEQQIDELYSRLSRAGERRVMFVTSAIGVSAASRAVIVDDGGLNLFSVQIESRSTYPRAATRVSDP